MSAPVLRIEDLRVSIAGDEGVARVLDHVELTIERGRIVGLVGESGCGKSTLVRTILGVLPPRSRVDRGHVRFEDIDILSLDEDRLQRNVRGTGIGFIPQDPFLAFNPVFSVGAQLIAAMRAHASLSRRELRNRLIATLRRLRLRRPEALLERYPHQLSGGQRQRLLIGGALALEPRLIVADEPTTALDSITQRQILALLKELTREFGLSLLFVTHDLGAAAQLCDDICVMYAGQVVESGPSAAVLGESRHPYTAALLACHPDRSDTLVGIPGQVPSPLAPPAGCRFAPRCSSALPGCGTRSPALRRTSREDHVVNCRLFDA